MIDLPIPACHMLYLEDEPDLARLTLLGLKRAGLSTYYANTGRKAIAYLKENKPDLMLLDLNVPDVGGWQVLRFAKEMYGEDAIPTVIATANRDEVNRLMGRLQYVAHYILKPYSIDYMVRVIHEAIAPVAVGLDAY